MDKIYRVWSGDDEIYEFGGMLDVSPKQNWFSTTVMEQQDFEDAIHKLIVLDADENEVAIDQLQDLDRVSPGIFAFSEKAWPLVSVLQNTGCRVAEHVKVEGSKRFKLVYPAPIFDLLDHEASDVRINEAAGAVSHVRAQVLYKTDQALPPMFQVMFHGPEKSGPSMDAYVTTAFIDLYKQLNLTGVEFLERQRSDYKP